MQAERRAVRHDLIILSKNISPDGSMARLLPVGPVQDLLVLDKGMSGYFAGGAETYATDTLSRVRVLVGLDVGMPVLLLLEQSLVLLLSLDECFLEEIGI